MYILSVFLFCFVHLLLTDVSLLMTFGQDAADRSVWGLAALSTILLCLLEMKLLGKEKVAVLMLWIRSSVSVTY